MVVIVLKLILAMVLTMVPFLFHYWVMPKGKTSQKWSSSYGFLASKMPWFSRKVGAVKAWLSYVHQKMHRSHNGRKFFILVLLIAMLLYQVVDFHAAQEAYRLQAESSSMGKDLSLTSYYITFPMMDSRVELGPKPLMDSVLYPFFTHFWVYPLAMMLTLPLFSYKVADGFLLRIHGSWLLQVILAFLSVTMAAMDYGRVFLLSELLFILLMAGMIYPFKQQPSSPGRKCWLWDRREAAEKKAA